MPKSLEAHFTDWEADLFGFGYGTGELWTIPAIKTYFEAIPEEGRYDFEHMERACGETVFWLLTNIFCSADIIEYGTSPRFGWLTEKGKAIQSFIISHSIEELKELTAKTYEDDGHIWCTPDYCNCGDGVDETYEKCGNPFWGQEPS